MSGHPSIPFLAGHCPLTGRHFKPCIGVGRVVICSHEVCDILVDLRLNSLNFIRLLRVVITSSVTSIHKKQSSIQDFVDKLSNTID